MYALRHSQRDLRVRQLDPADFGERATHLHRGRTGARSMPFAVEPQQQRVAAELEQAGAVLVGNLQDRREAAADRVGDVFGTLSALARELLGQRREAGYVGEHGGTFGNPAGRPRIIDQVMLEDARQIRDGAFSVGFRRWHVEFGVRLHRMPACYRGGQKCQLVGARAAGVRRPAQSCVRCVQ